MAASVAASVAVSAGAGAAGGGAAGGGASSGAGGGGGGGGGGGSVNMAGDPLSLLFIMQFLFMTSKLAVTAAQYADFAKGFALFSLVLAPPSFAKDFMDGFPFLGPCCDHYFQDDTEETRVLKGHYFQKREGAILKAL